MRQGAVKGLPTVAKSFTKPDVTSSDAEVVPKSVAKAKGMCCMMMGPLRKPGWTSWMTVGCISYMEAWKGNCATLDEKVTDVTKQLDEKVVAISRQLAQKEVTAAKQLQGLRGIDFLRAGARFQARAGQFEGRLDTEIEQLNDELAGLEDRIFDEIRGEQVYCTAGNSYTYFLFLELICDYTHITGGFK